MNSSIRSLIILFISTQTLNELIFSDLRFIVKCVILVKYQLLINELNV